MNNWHDVESLQCEYDFEIFCLKNGEAVLDSLQLKSVNNEIKKIIYLFNLYLNLKSFNIKLKLRGTIKN